MNHGDELGTELLLLVGFLLTSARGLVDEPQSYGPSRLLEAGGRVLALMDQQGMLDAPLQAIRSDIDEERFGPMKDEEVLVARLDELALRWTEVIATRV